MKTYKQMQMIIDINRVILERRDVSGMTWDEYKEWLGGYEKKGFYMMTYDRPKFKVGEVLDEYYSSNWRACGSWWNREHSYTKVIHEFNPMFWEHLHTLYDEWKAWGEENGVEVTLDTKGLCRPPQEGAYGGATLDCSMGFKSRFCSQGIDFKSLVWDTRQDRGLCFRPFGETEFYRSGLTCDWDKRVKYRSIEDLRNYICNKITEWSLPREVKSA